MFTKLLDFFENQWDNARYTWKGFWEYGKEYWTWIVAMTAAAMAFIDWIAAKAGELLGWLTAKLGGIEVAATPNASGLTDILSFANWILPVNEVFAMIIALSALWVAMLLYRFFKSWIPTVN